MNKTLTLLVSASLCSSVQAGLSNQSTQYRNGQVFHTEIKYPVTADVTLRRRQKFLPKPGETVRVKINGKVSEEKIGSNGLLTVPMVRFADAKTLEIEIVGK